MATTRKRAARRRTTAPRVSAAAAAAAAAAPAEGLPPTVPPPPPQAEAAAEAPQKLSPEQSLQELALVCHRLNGNLLALAHIQAQQLELARKREVRDEERLELERRRLRVALRRSRTARRSLLVERAQLRVAREQLALSKEARATVAAVNQQSEAAQSFAERVLQPLVERIMGMAAAEPRSSSAPALANGAAAPSGLVVRGA